MVWPVQTEVSGMDDFDNIPEQALAWHEDGAGAVLATVMQTWGSAPRRVGAQLAVSGDGEIAGSVSGGCVEGAVIVEALEALEDGGVRELEFGVSDDDAFAVGLACGGTIRVLVEPVGGSMPEALLRELCEARAARRPVAYVADLDSGARRVETEGHEDRFRMDRSGFEGESRCFVAVHNPPLRLIVVGAVHIAQALVPMARAAGYDALVVDPRETFATPARFPGTPLLHDWPDEAVAGLGAAEADRPAAGRGGGSPRTAGGCTRLAGGSSRGAPRWRGTGGRAVRRARRGGRGGGRRRGRRRGPRAGRRRGRRRRGRPRPRPE